MHLDGYNFLPYLTGQESKARGLGSSTSRMTAIFWRCAIDNWKIVFVEQRSRGTLELWAEPFTHLRVPKIFNLRTDPFERADITSNTYYDWLIDHVFILIPAQAIVGEFLATFKDYPPRQKAASFTIDQVMEKLTMPRGD